jgi:hypothetical protein
VFRRRNREEAEPVEAQEAAVPGTIEGPFEVDRVYLGEAGDKFLEFQDLMNARVGEGYELITTILAGDRTQGSATHLLIVWRGP